MLFEDHTLYSLTRFLLISFGTFGMVTSTTRFSRHYKRNLLLLLPYMLYAFAASWFFISLLGYIRFLRIFIFIITIPAYILMYFISDEPLPRLIFTRVTQLLFSIYVAGSAALFNALLHGNMLSSLLILLLFYVLVITLEFLLLRKNFMYIANTIQKGWGILSLIPCALTVLTLLVALYPVHYTKSRFGTVLCYLLLAVILVIYVVIFLHLRLLYQRQMSERNIEILKLQVQNIRQENENIEALTKQTKIIQHDTRHMLSVIASFAEKGDAPAILDYIGRITGKDTLPEPAHYCSDPVLDATLSSCFVHAENMGFTLETSLSIPDALPVDSAELAICFANALECAAGLGSVPENQLAAPERKLVIKCIDTPKLMFEVLAPCQDSLAFDRNQFPKTENVSLSLNINSVREFCKRHDAVYSFTAGNGQFVIKVAL